MCRVRSALSYDLPKLIGGPTERTMQFPYPSPSCREIVGSNGGWIEERFACPRESIKERYAGSLHRLFCLFSNSFPLWPKHLPRSASPPATPTSSPVFRRRARPKPSSNAGGRTGRTKSRTCYPPSTLPRGYRQTSICLSRMHHSTGRTPTLTPLPELASLAPAAADTTSHSLPTWFPTSALIQAAITSRLRPS